MIALRDARNKCPTACHCLMNHPQNGGKAQTRVYNCEYLRFTHQFMCTYELHTSAINHLFRNIVRACVMV